MGKNTKWGFPQGRVHETLRKILYPELTDPEANAVIVCLLCHLLIEGRINEVLHRWLSYDMPARTENEQDIKKGLWKEIAKIDFAKKYSLIEPSFSVWFKEAASDIWKLNDLRTSVFHGKAVRGAKFKGKEIASEEGIEELFVCSQLAAQRLDEFDEMVDSRRAAAERLAEKMGGSSEK